MRLRLGSAAHQQRRRFQTVKKKACRIVLLGVTNNNLPIGLVAKIDTGEVVHLLARFGRTITQAEWVKELKRVSNLWLKERGRDHADFEWQGGYADFSVSQSKLPEVKEYIAGQEEHHCKIGFQDELRALLRKHEIEWDEKYVWD